MQNFARRGIRRMPRALPRKFLQTFLEVEAVFLANPFAKLGNMRHPAVIDESVALLYTECLTLFRKPLRERLGVRAVLHIEIFHMLDVLEEQIVAAGVEHDQYAFEFVQMAPQDHCVAAVARCEQADDTFYRDHRFLEQVVDAVHTAVCPLKGTQNEQRITARHIVGGDFG